MTITERDAPSMGDEAVAQVLEFELPDGPTVVRDVLAMRIGDVVVLTEGPDVAEGDPELARQRERFEDLTGQAVDGAAGVLAD